MIRSAAMPDPSHTPHQPAPPPGALAGAVDPLRSVYWGALVVLVDITFFGFDVLVDFIGWLIVLGGAIGLFRLPMGWRFRQRMLFTALVSILFLLRGALPGSAVARHADWIPQVIGAVLVLGSIALGVICLAMARASRAGACGRAAEAWDTAWRGSLFLHIAPAAWLFVLPLVRNHLPRDILQAIPDMQPSGLGRLAMKLLLLVPIFLFGIAITRMREDLKRAGDQPETGESSDNAPSPA